MTARIVWTCPHCRTQNSDEIDPVLGPFFSCACDECGTTFDQSAVPGLRELGEGV